MAAGEEEKPESGSPIYRHKPRETAWKAPANHGLHLAEIEAHVEKHVGKIESVFHEVLSDLIHLDVLFVPATNSRPYHVLIASGVSDEPMNVPEGMEQFRFAEILIALPPSWPLDQKSFEDEANYWPVRWLKAIGRLPHEYRTWIGWGHTVPNGDPPETIANTQFVGVLLTPPYAFSPEFFRLTTKSGETISFYAMMPLFQEEMDLKLKKGVEELEQRFEKRGVDFVLDLARINVAKARGWFSR